MIYFTGGDEGKEHLQQIYQWYLDNKHEAGVYHKDMRQQRKQNEAQVGNDPFVSYVCLNTAPVCSLQKRNVNDEISRGRIGKEKTCHYVPTSSSVGCAREYPKNGFKPKWGKSSRRPASQSLLQNHNTIKSQIPIDEKIISSSNDRAVQQQEEIEQSISDEDISIAISPSLSASTPREFQGLNKRCNVVNFELDPSLPFVDVCVNRLPYRRKSSPFECLNKRSCTQQQSTDEFLLDEDKQNNHESEICSNVKKITSNRVILSASRTSITLDQRPNRESPNKKSSKPLNLNHHHRYRPKGLLQRRHHEVKEENNDMRGGDVGKCVWVTKGTTFPKNKGYIHFTRSLVHTVDVNNSTKDNTSSRTTHVYDKVDNKSLSILNSLKKQGRTPRNLHSNSVVGPPMKTRGENISLTPRPPTAVSKNALRKGGIASKRVLSQSWSSRSRRTDNENEMSPSMDNDDNGDMASPRMDVKSPRMRMEEKYTDASELLKEQNRAAVNI